MQCPIWIGSPVDVRYGNEALDALRSQNDIKYWDKNLGSVRIDQDRWEQAQKYEFDTWMEYYAYAQDDRSTEHTSGFNNYVNLPHCLGDVIEIGCGPFTQLVNILNLTHTAKSVTLSDPLLSEYLKHPNCSYANHRLGHFDVVTIASPAEKITAREKYDTVVCVNVLEHVYDVPIILDNILNMLRIGGYVVMSERTYDDLDSSLIYDVGHPIRVKSCVLDRFYNNFQILYHNNNYVIGIKKAVS